jgi:DNA-binding MarR family transcriptional regulator
MVGAAQLGPAELTRHIGYLLRRAHVLWNDCAKACASDDVLPREVAILALLAERQPISQRELGELLQVNRSVMVSLLDSLEKSGRVVRERNPRDRRSYALRLTSSGRDVLVGGLGDLRNGDDVLTSRLDQAERRWLNGALLDLLETPELAPIESLAENTGYLISLAHRQMRQRTVERLAPIGLHPRHFGALNVLADIRPCSQTQLAACLGISPPAALSFVDELEARALVTRERSTTDRRVHDVQLTAEGRGRLGLARAAATGLEDDIVARIGARHDEMRRLLLKLLT